MKKEYLILLDTKVSSNAPSKSISDKNGFRLNAASFEDAKKQAENQLNNPNCDIGKKYKGSSVMSVHDCLDLSFKLIRS